MENRFKAAWLKTAGSPGGRCSQPGQRWYRITETATRSWNSKAFLGGAHPTLWQIVANFLNSKIKYVGSRPTSLVSFILTGKGPFLPGNHLFKKPVRTGIHKALWSYKAKTAAIRKEKWESRSVVSDSLRPHGLYTVHGILQATTLEWVAFPFSSGSSPPRDWTQVSRMAGGFFISWATREAQEYWSR